MNNNVIRCPHCENIFFDIGNDVCPFCKKQLSKLPDFFDNIFGNQNNPFQDFTNQGENDGLY